MSSATAAILPAGGSINNGDGVAAASSGGGSGNGGYISSSSGNNTASPYSGSGGGGGSSSRRARNSNTPMATSPPSRAMEAYAYSLFVILGIGSWITINGIYLELPLLVNSAPEGWALATYLALVTQVRGAAAWAAVRCLCSCCSRFCCC